MITIFACPKSFDKGTRLIQTNAINSWKKLGSDVEIILLGNHESVKEFAVKNNVAFIGGVRSNNYKTPYVDSLFKLAAKASHNAIMAYLNSDIILFEDFLRSVKSVLEKESKFLIVGQRIDLKIERNLDFSDKGSVQNLLNFALRKGKKHGIAGIDYFVFRKRSLGGMPKFLIGRDSWDNWMIYNALNKGLKVVDATESIIALHQEHDYSHLTKEKKHKEDSSNDKIAKGKVATLNDSNYYLDSDLKLHKKNFFEIKFPKLITFVKLNILILLRSLRKKIVTESDS